MLKSTINFVDSIIDFCGKATSSLLTNSEPFPRWKAPAGLTEETFDKKAEANYRQEMSKKKSDQDIEKLMNRGNDYYFSLSVKKAYRMFKRGRIASVSINKSLEKGLSDPTNGFLNKKYKLLGDKVDPNDVGEVT